MPSLPIQVLRFHFCACILISNFLSHTQRFNFTPGQLDRFYHLKMDKKKKIDKKEEETLLEFMSPLVCNDVNLQEKKGFTEFRDSLEKTFAPLVGSWKDKKKENK